MANNPIQYDNKLLIAREDIDRECRPCNAQDALVDRCIEEAQNLEVRIGGCGFLTAMMMRLQPCFGRVASIVTLAVMPIYSQD